MYADGISAKYMLHSTKMNQVQPLHFVKRYIDKIIIIQKCKKHGIIEEVWILILALDLNPVYDIH